MSNEWHLHTMEFKDGKYHYTLYASYEFLDDALAHQRKFSSRGMASNVSSEKTIKPNMIFNIGFPEYG